MWIPSRAAAGDSRRAVKSTEWQVLTRAVIRGTEPDRLQSVWYRHTLSTGDRQCVADRVSTSSPRHHGASTDVSRSSASARWP
jgi:hypothetical protein